MSRPNLVPWILPLTALFPSLSKDLWQMALLRFSTKKYAFFKKSFLVDLALTLLATPLIIVFSLTRSRRQPAAKERVEVLFECGDTSQYQAYFRKIEESLKGVECRKSGIGEGMDYPPITNIFSIPVALRTILGLIPLAPYLFVLSLFYRRNLLSAFVRICVIYARSLYYFRRFPCRLFLTYADNSCSPPLYAAFKKTGGEAFSAFQNGIRFADEGVEYSCFDHLFAIGRSFVDFHRELGSLIQGYSEIGSLTLGTHQELVGKTERIDYDVMFIDQGFPNDQMFFWPVDDMKPVEAFVEYARRFARDNPKLRMVYQMRCYDQETKFLEGKIAAWFQGTPITVLTGCAPMQSYNTITRSNVVVTMCSTLGLAALLMDRPVLFFNFPAKKIYNVVSGKLQATGYDYATFQSKIREALSGRIGLKDIDVDYYISRNTWRAPEIIVEEIRRSLS